MLAIGTVAVSARLLSLSGIHAGIAARRANPNLPPDPANPPKNEAGITRNLMAELAAHEARAEQGLGLGFESMDLLTRLEQHLRRAAAIRGGAVIGTRAGIRVRDAKTSRHWTCWVRLENAGWVVIETDTIDRGQSLVVLPTGTIYEITHRVIETINRGPHIALTPLPIEDQLAGWGADV